MKAIKLGSAGVELERAYRPSVRPSEARLRLRVGGICATDLELVRGYMDFRGVIGHEFVAEVIEADDSALLGQRVVGDINASCGACETCLVGRSTHCPHRTVLGILGRDGAFSEEFFLPAQNLHVVPDNVADEAAVFVEPLAAACRILAQVHVRPSDRVVVLGLGRLGQLCLRVLALTGADAVGVSRSKAKRALVPVGVPAVDPETARQGPLADIVVDCTGSADGLATASGLVRPGGTLVLKTTVHDLGEVRPSSWVVDEVTVVGSRCGPFAPALRLLASGLVDPTPLITASRALEDGLEALDLASQSTSLKVLLDARR